MKRLTLLMLMGICFVFSTQLFAQTSVNQINNYLDQRLENNELKSQDVQWQITDQHLSSASGVEHVYFCQVINGIPIYGTTSGIHMLPNGDVLSVDDNFIANTANRMAGSETPTITAVQAVQSAAAQLNYSVSESINVLEAQRDVQQTQLLSTGGVSMREIPAKLMYQLNDNGELVLAWDISIESPNRLEWFSMRVDASTGEIVNKNNWIVQCGGLEHDHSSHDAELDYNANLYDIPNYDELVADAEAGCNECYEALEFPIESPYYGVRTSIMQPANLTASPFGWHDTDGAPGAEFTTTRGNNVDAVESGDNSGFRPDGGATLDFTGYAFDQVWSNGTQYEEASITNLFYWNNIMHDMFYLYGFNEVAGNFQENNYGNGGAGSDSVNANGQIGIFCNATMGTPADGGNPTMSMYICGDKDGDFDNLVVAHEWAHGISNRLTGGPGASGCLGNSEQMGEGWSDYFGAWLSIEPGDTGADARGVGTYLFGQGPGGGGIRSFPYSTDLAVNPMTYDDIKTESVPHGVGSVWATMIWEMTWALINQYGYDPDFYNFTGDVAQDAGNIQAMALVIEGMKLQPCSPGFVDGRDAILAADLAIYGGANECLIWDAFAKRGLGVSASQGSSGSRSDGVEAFDTPSGVASFTAPPDLCLTDGVQSGLGGGTPFGGVYSGPGVTDDGNGTTYTFDPVAAGVGTHTITYDVPAGPCSVASSASDTVEVLAVPSGPATTGANDICVGDSVTVTAVPNDPANVIRWYDAETGGNFLFEGTDYTFNPTGNTSVWAQENPPGPLSQLVISELALETPDQLEIQNVGIAADYSAYTVAVSEQPYSDINAVNSVQNSLGPIGADGVIAFNDDGGAGYWGDNIWWDNLGTGWVIIVDGAGNVVDSVFWGFTAAEIAGLNVSINGFNITAADLDWSGDGANLTANCSGSFRRIGDTDTSADWSGICETADFGVANADIGLGFTGCLGERTETIVTVDAEAPAVTCPANMSETINAGSLFSIPDYTPMASATDNCTASPILTQNPTAGTEVPGGVYTVTITATDAAGNANDCTFELEVIEVLGTGDNDIFNNIVLYPNPTQGELTISNNSAETIVSATITDVNGRVIQVIDLRNAGTTSNISMEALSTGMYFVQLELETTTIVKQIVKQ